jgi:hypothetical protein
MLEDRLMKEPGRAPITESSFADGCEEVSDEEVDVEAVGLWEPIGPCDKAGDDAVRMSCLRLGVD